jgi:hypothetical protein
MEKIMNRQSIFILGLAFGFLFLSVFPAQAKPGLADYKKGYNQYQRGHYEKALHYFLLASDEDLNFWQAFHMMGNCYFLLKDKDAALAAFKESLKINPQNKILIKNCWHLEKGILDYAQPPALELVAISPPMDPPVTIPAFVIARVSGMSISSSTGVGTPVTKRSSKDEERTPLWVKLNSSYGFSGMGDLSSGASAWNKNLDQNGMSGYANSHNMGMEFGLETGYNWGKKDALSLGVAYLGGQGYKASALSPSPAVFQSINPETYSADLNYYRYFPGRDSRFFVMGGVGYYLSFVNYFQTDSVESVTGSLSGGNFGAIVGIGNEWYFSKSVGMEVSGRFRYANISKIQGNVSGISNGAAALAVLSNGTLGVQDAQNIGSGNVNYASIDYTGFDLKVAMDLYLF